MHVLRCLCVAAALVTTAATAADYIASGSRPYLRSDPGPAGDSVGRLDAREPVEVVEREGRWVRVETADGARGWVRASQIRRPL